MSEGTGSKPWDADMEYNNLRIAHDQLFDKVIALRAENTRLRGILRDLAGCEDQDLIKGHVVMSTLEVDALRAEVERLNGRFDTANQVIAHRENECAMLRAEVAALQADCRTLETAKADAEALAMSYEGTAERLQAELAKYTEPLGDEQIVAIEKATAHLPRFGNRSDWWDMRDAVIRRVRKGE